MVCLYFISFCYKKQQQNKQIQWIDNPLPKTEMICNAPNASLIDFYMCAKFESKTSNPLKAQNMGLKHPCTDRLTDVWATPKQYPSNFIWDNNIMIWVSGKMYVLLHVHNKQEYYFKKIINCRLNANFSKC